MIKSESILSPDDLCLKTPRLLLRPLSLDDLDLAKKLFTDPDVMRYVADVSAEEALPGELKTAVQRGAGGRIGVWCVCDRSTGDKLGTAILLPLPIDIDDTDWSLLQQDRYPDAEIEIGYILKRTAWGKGYATEACSRLLRFGFENTSLEEIVAVTDQDNVASQHVLTKCGLRNDGLRLAYLEQCSSFRVSRQEWAVQQDSL